MCARPLCFSRYKVLAVGECKHVSLLSNGKCWEPPYLAPTTYVYCRFQRRKFKPLVALLVLGQ
jgi:hypothetical protein